MPAPDRPYCIADQSEADSAEPALNDAASAALGAASAAAHRWTAEMRDCSACFGFHRTLPLALVTGPTMRYPTGIRPPRGHQEGLYRTLGYLAQLASANVMWPG